jgi:hypothetical protein
LEKHGVLINFRIARKVRNIDLRKVKVPRKKKATKKEKLQQFISKLTSDTNEEIKKGLVPGLIMSEVETPPMSIHDKISDKKMIELNVLSGVFANQLVSKKLDKDEVCYTVLNLLTLLGLIDEDFKEFHRKYNHPGQDEPDEDDDGDEEQQF